MNGQWYDESGRVESLPLDDRGLHYGDGLFETVAIRLGKPRLWELHLERLQLGCTRLGIPVPREEVLLERMQTGIRESGPLAVGLAKIIVTRGSSPRGYRYASGLSPRILTGFFEKQDIPAAHRNQGVRVRICSTRLAAQPALGGIKSLNRLEQVLARAEWQEDSISEGLMMNADDQVVCGTMSNLFVVHESRLKTPSITVAGVSGVMRRQILSLAESNGIQVDVEPIPLSHMGHCSEVFICNSQFGILPVRQCGETEYLVPGKQTAIIKSLLAGSGIEECAS